MSRQGEVHYIVTEQLTIPAGTTLGVYLAQQPGEVSMTVKYGSGGSLIAVGTTTGSTLSAANLAALGASCSYLFGTTETLSFGGPARFYLCAPAAAVQAFVIRGFCPQ